MLQQTEEESPTYISDVWLSESSTVPRNILEFDYSFGYNCKKLFNLCLISDDVLVFSSGNYIHYYNITTSKISYRRSAGGGGIGFILKNPNPEYNYLTICENGINPLVMIYKYPSNDVIVALKNGAKNSFTCANYQPNGKLLATQSGEPDYMITIWDWKVNTIILRCESYQNDILNIIFSPYNSNLLTTCGLGHIKFWKMAKTFTGLKLQSDLGRFGKTEITDIYTIYMLPDEKVISSCEWGNMLLWDMGLIKLEVCRKNRKSCHNGPITYIHLDNGELMTASIDGYIRIWFWETVELFDPPDDDRFIEIEPIYEFQIGNNDRLCEIRHLIKIKSNDPVDCRYFVQDGKGGIWICWLDRNNIPETPHLIYSCHGGQILSADTSPISSHIATIGIEGRLHFYNYAEKSLQFFKQFQHAGTDLLWIPKILDKSGCVIIASFEDGIIREFITEFDENLTIIKNIHLIGVIKPHNKGITKLSLNINKEILVSGANDQTIFIQKIIKIENNYIKLIPIGFVQLSSIPTAMNWTDKDNKILIGTNIGEIFKIELPDQLGNTDVTFKLSDLNIKMIKFNSIKSEIRRNIRLKEKEKKKEEKKQKKLIELMKLKEKNPEIEINENMIGDDSEEEKEEPPLYYPPVPNPILWLRYTPENTIWISVGGYDAGYIYEMVFDEDKPKRCTMIADGDDIEIYYSLSIDKYLIFATQNGILRINIVNSNNYLDLTNYYLIGVHDNKNSIVSKICTSHDGKHLFTIGYDGNIFSFNWNGPIVIKNELIATSNYIEPKIIDDIQDILYPSLEDEKIQIAKNNKIKIREDRKAKIINIAAGYRLEFKEILKRNQTLAISQQYTDEELELDKRITEDLRLTLTAELDLVRRKLAYDVEKAVLGKKKVMDFFISPLEHMPFEIKGIVDNTTVKSFRIKKLTIEIEEIIKEIEKRLLLLGESTSDDNNDEISDINMFEREKSFDISVPDPPEETFFLGLNPDDIIPKFSSKMERLLNRYRQRKLHQMQRYVDWEKMNFKKPNPNKNHIDDIKSIGEAKRSIGDYKLKTDSEFEPKSSDNVLNKYKELLRAREVLYKNKKEFNMKLFKLRDRKKKLYDIIKLKNEKLNVIHEYVPDKEKQNLPLINCIDLIKEYPEENHIEHIKSGTGIEISNLFKVQKPSAEIDNPSLINLIPLEEINIDEDQTEKFRHNLINIDLIKKLPDKLEIISIMTSSTSYLNSIDMKKSNDKKEPTILEMEMKYQIIINKIVEQNEIITEINCKIKEFDNELIELGESKLQIEVDSKFLEIYLITLNEELVILKDCEKLENELSLNTLKAMNEKNSLKEYIDELVKNLDEIKRNCDKMNEQIRQITTSFLTHIKGNKFFEFLKRIFKKKYRVPKLTTNDDIISGSDLSSESSSNEEENDNKSQESFDMMAVYFDENVCPQKCDKKLYDLAFQLRDERHNLEQTIQVQNKLKDLKQNQLNEQRKKFSIIENLFLQERKKLIDFRRQKQSVLNKVSSVVVLHMDQLQYLKEKQNINNIPNTLLFGLDNVLQLYSRVNQLDLETLETKRVHRINIIHLTRMSTDCKYMNRQIHLLQEDIQQAMYRKFGRQLDVDHLEEETLRRFIFQLQTTLDDERRAILKQVEEKKKRLAELEKTLNHGIQLGAEKLNILTILQEEKNFLHDVLNLQVKNFEKARTAVHYDFRHDLDKLKDVEKHQKEQIENLEKEIRSLRFKTKLLQVHPKESEEPPPPDSTVEILPPDDLLNDDDRLYKNIEAILPMTHQFGPDVFTIDKIKKIVHTFMIKTFIKQMIPEDCMRKYIEKISKFLGYVAKNFECDDMEKVMDCIVEQFQNIVPKKYLLHVQPQQIKELFKEIVGVFRYEKIEINIEEVIVGIVNNTFELIQHIKPKPLNFTQAALVEIFKEMIEVLTVGDLKKPQTVGKLYELLLRNSAFNPKCIDLNNLINEVIDYARSSLLDEFTQHPIKEFAETLHKKFKIPLKSERAIKDN